MTKVSAFPVNSAPTANDYVPIIDAETVATQRSTLSVLFASAPFTAGLFAFVTTDGTLAANSDSLIPSEKAVKTYVDNNTGSIPTFTTNDTGTWPVSTVGNQTTLNLSNALSATQADLSDAYFRLHNSGVATARVIFAVSNSTAGVDRTITIPDANDTLALLTATQTITNKTLRQPVVIAHPVNGGTAMTVASLAPASPLNTTGHGIEVYPSASIGAHLAFAHCGGDPTTPTQTLMNATLMRVTARGYTNGSAYGSAATMRIDATAAEAFTATAQGTRLDVFVTPATTVTAVNALRVTSDSVPQLVSRGPLVVNAGSGMASARTGLAFDLAAEGGFAYNPATSLTYASPTSVDTTKGPNFKVTTVNATGNVTFNATSGGVEGQMMLIAITNDATSGKTITFGTNFRSTGTLTGTTSRVMNIAFKSDGTNWVELYRTAAIA